MPTLGRHEACPYANVKWKVMTPQEADSLESAEVGENCHCFRAALARSSRSAPTTRVLPVARAVRTSSASSTTRGAGTRSPIARRDQASVRSVIEM